MIEVTDNRMTVRNVIGFELKESYYAQALRNVELAKQLAQQSTEVMPLLAMIG